MKKALFPGTFEVFHNGHINVLKKALEIFDFIYVVVSNNENKDYTDINLRYKNAKKIIDSLNYKNISIIYNENTTPYLAEKLDIYHIIRGVRNEFDIQYEIALLDSYKSLNQRIEMIIFISNSIERRISSHSILNKKKGKKNE